MALSLLLSRLQNKSRKVNRSSPTRRAQLNLEALEDRTLPAVSVAQLYVADIYNAEFGRNGSDSEIAFGAGQLLPGFTSTDVAKLILSTPGFQAVEVRQLYLRFAGINPGSDAISFWLDFLTQPGNTMDTVRADFFSSDIYYNRVGGTNTAYVSALFGDVWSQPANPTVLNQFVTALNNGASRLTIATDFITDPRDYQAQIVADYDKVLEHDPDAASLSFFTGFRQGGGTNEQILAQLHGSSELMKHLQFFQSHTVLTDPNIAAQTFRAQLQSQIQAEQTAQTMAVNAAAQAQQDATTAAADEADAAMQVTNAKAAFNDPNAAQVAATQAQNDATDAQAKANDAVTQANIARTALLSAEPTPITIQAAQQAQASSMAAGNSSQQAQKDAQDAQTAANAASSNSDFQTFLMNLKNQADAAASAVDGFKTQANTAAGTAATDASTAQSDANTAFMAVNGAPNYPANSQAAQLINAAMTSAQAAQTAASAAAGFSTMANTDRNTVVTKDTDADNAAAAVDDAVSNPMTGALAILQQLQSGTFNFFDLFMLIDQFFTDLGIAQSQELVAIQAKNDAQTALNSSLTDKTNADAQLSAAGLALMQTNTDISQAAAAYQAAANTGGSGTGNSGDGNDNGNSGRGDHGGGHQG